MTLSQSMATPATMMVFAICNSAADYLGNNRGAEFKSSFLFGDYMFEVQTDTHENICVDLYKLQADRDKNIAMHLNEEYTEDPVLLSIKQPMVHTMEGAVALVEELCYNIYNKLDEQHRYEVEDALLGYHAKECYQAWQDCLNDIFYHFSMKEDIEISDGDEYVMLSSPQDAPFFLNARQYERFKIMLDAAK